MMILKMKMVNCNLFFVLMLMINSVWSFPAIGDQSMLDTVLDDNDNNGPINSKICENKHDGELIPDKDDQNVFYECNQGKTFKFHCPPHLIFNDQLKSCDFDPNQVTKLPPYHGDSKYDCTGKSDGFYPDVNDRTRFHECINGYPYDFVCPPQTIFDNVRKACAFDPDHKDAVTTTTEAAIVPSTTNPTTIISTDEPVSRVSRDVSTTPEPTTPTPNESTTTEYVTSVPTEEPTTRGRHH